MTLFPENAAAGSKHDGAHVLDGGKLGVRAVWRSADHPLGNSNGTDPRWRKYSQLYMGNENGQTRLLGTSEYV